MKYINNYINMIFINWTDILQADRRSNVAGHINEKG